MERLKQIREKNGWSQMTLAEHVGVSRTAIAQYESGARRPTGDIVVKIARLLGVSSAYLLGHADSPERDDRLPEDWVAVVEEAMSDGFSPQDIRRMIQGLKVVLGRDENPKPAHD